jgi:hypothetical protein
VATEYGGTCGDQPWRDTPPQYPDQPHPDQQYPDQQYPDQHGPDDGSAAGHGSPPRPRRPAAATALAGVALVLGLIGLVVSVYGVATQVMPRRFTPAQQQQIVNWESGRDWRTMRAGAIFPASVSYAPPAVLDGGSPLTLTASRIGIAKQATCKAGADDAAAAVLDGDGCSALLRATYTDGTKSYAVTVGVAVLPSTAQAARAAAALEALGDAGGIAPGVHAVAFKYTPADWFTNQRRQLSGSSSRGPYVALYTVGYADSRPREQVSDDSYAAAEMMSVGSGVAQAVLTAIAPPVATPHCPGTTGC